MSKTRGKTGTAGRRRRWLTIEQVRARYGDAARSTIRRRVERGEFPAPRQFGRLNLWDEEQLDQYDATRPIGWHAEPAELVENPARADRRKRGRPRKTAVNVRSTAA